MSLKMYFLSTYLPSSTIERLIFGSCKHDIFKYYNDFISMFSYIRLLDPLNCFTYKYVKITYFIVQYLFEYIYTLFLNEFLFTF